MAISSGTACVVRAAMDEAAAKRGILCFGEALIDFLARPGDTADAPRAFLQFAGGAPANVAVSVARLLPGCAPVPLRIL